MEITDVASGCSRKLLRAPPSGALVLPSSRPSPRPAYHSSVEDRMAAVFGGGKPRDSKFSDSDSYAGSGSESDDVTSTLKKNSPALPPKPPVPGPPAPGTVFRADTPFENSIWQTRLFVGELSRQCLINKVP